MASDETQQPQRYAVQINLTGRRCLVVGGGRVATRKVQSMLSAGAAVRVVAPRLTVRLTELLAQGRIEHRDHEYRPADLDNCALAVAATNDRALNRLIADDACAANILVNIVDAPELSSFIVPSTANRGRISVSVSTDGASPVLATHLRDEIDRMLGHQWSAVADALHDTRAALIEAIPDPAERSLAVSRLLRDGIDERIGAGTIGRDELVSAAMATPVGHVALIGAGPGDPGLLTLRGAALLGRADVVVHDRLGTERVLPLAHPRCELIDVGKAPGRHGMEQQDINELLVQLAARGLRVVRLKGGDPFIFGRGGEEALALADAGIAFEIVPGISSAIGGAGRDDRIGPRRPDGPCGRRTMECAGRRSRHAGAADGDGQPGEHRNRAHRGRTVRTGAGLRDPVGHDRARAARRCDPADACRAVRRSRPWQSGRRRDRPGGGGRARDCAGTPARTGYCVAAPAAISASRPPASATSVKPAVFIRSAATAERRPLRQ
jgi:uroporphyrin-III C-methyltransferase/precorrin-2 dehydrogenase/sirohydrochlorin ferrochelatase